MLTLSCIGESGSLLSTSVQCFCCLSFSKVLHMEYICLSVLVPQEKKKKKRKEIKKKNHKEINKHLLFPDLQLFGLRSACRQSQNKNPRMSIYLHRFLLACMRVFKILYLFHFVSSYFITEWTLHLLLFYCPGFVLSNVYFLFPYTPYFVFNKVEIFFKRLENAALLQLSPLPQQVSYVRLPPAASGTLKMKLKIKYVWGHTIIKVHSEIYWNLII